MHVVAQRGETWQQLAREALGASFPNGQWLLPAERLTVFFRGIISASTAFVNMDMFSREALQRHIDVVPEG
eukprot:COSAG01_NODE_43564_length_428_cov_1.841945_1_plen_70_part_10